MCGEGFELQRGRNYTQEVTVTPAECRNIWICNYTLFAIQIFVSRTVYDFLQPSEHSEPRFMSGSGLSALFCSHRFGSGGVESNTLQHFEAGLAKKLLICKKRRTSSKLEQT